MKIACLINILLPSDVISAVLGKNQHHNLAHREDAVHIRLRKSLEVIPFYTPRLVLDFEVPC